MQMTLAQIMSMVTTFNQGRTDVPTSEVSMYVNLAADELATRIPMKSLESYGPATVAYQTSAVTFSEASVHHIVAVSNLSQPANSAGRSLRPATVEWMDSQSTFYGTPTHYATYGWGGFRVWPSVDTDTLLQVRSQLRLPEVTSSSGTFDIDPKWHPAIAYRAAALIAGSRNDLENEATNQARYLAFVNSNPSDIETKQRQQGGFSVTIPGRK
jgi:hypothetical protein